MRTLGIAHPRCLAFNDVEAALARWGNPWPALLKPEQGGSGARMYLLNEGGELSRLLRDRPELWLPRQSSDAAGVLPGGRGARHRTHGIPRRRTALRHACGASHGAFNHHRCPSVECNPESGGESLCAVPEAKPARPVEFYPYPEVPAAAVESGKRIMAAGGLDVGGIEYLEASDGRLIFYDVNANSNLRAPIGQAFGFDPFERVVDYLISIPSHSVISR